MEEAQTLLDEHIVKTQAMRASPFAVPFMDRVVPWEERLTRLQDIVDAWLRCQSKWLYLEPIFNSEEIMKQIPTEGAAFMKMDQSWLSHLSSLSAPKPMKTKNRAARSIASASNAILDVTEKTARTTHSENKRARARRRRTMRIRSRPLTRIARMLTASRNGRRGAARGDE